MSGAGPAGVGVSLRLGRQDQAYAARAPHWAAAKAGAVQWGEAGRRRGRGLCSWGLGAFSAALRAT